MKLKEFEEKFIEDGNSKLDKVFSGREIRDAILSIMEEYKNNNINELPDNNDKNIINMMDISSFANKYLSGNIKLNNKNMYYIMHKGDKLLVKRAPLEIINRDVNYLYSRFIVNKSIESKKLTGQNIKFLIYEIRSQLLEIPKDSYSNETLIQIENFIERYINSKFPISDYAIYYLELDPFDEYHKIQCFRWRF